jgi:hypothetical protein
MQSVFRGLTNVGNSSIGILPLRSNSRFLNRGFCTDLNNKALDVRKLGLKMMPHDISYQMAAKEFVEYDKNRFFASETPTVIPAVWNGSPLKKILLPFFTFDQAETESVQYEGKCGTEIWDWEYVKIAGKKDEADTYEWQYKYQYTDWEDMDPGVVPAVKFTKSNLREYAGNTYDRELINKAFASWDCDDSAFKIFDPSQVAEDIVLDPYQLHEEDAKTVFKSVMNRVAQNHLYQLAYNDAEIRYPKYDRVSVENPPLCYRTFKVKGYLLPGYILQYPGQPARIMSALNAKEIKIYGVNPKSLKKTTGTAFGVSTAVAFGLSMMFPEFTIPASILSVASVTFLTWHRNRTALSRANKKSAAQIEERKLLCQKSAKSPSDVLRLAATEQKIIAIEKAKTKYCPILDLDEQSPLTEDMVHDAYNKKIKELRSKNMSFSSEEAQKATEAMTALLQMVS